MKPKALMLLAVAIGCGLVAMLGVQQAMQGSQKEVVIETAKVLTAIKDIRPGDRLNEENVVFKDVPVTSLISMKGDFITKPEEYLERSVTIPVVVGDIIHKTKLTEKGMFGASSQIPKGMRIFTFSATDAHTHSGMLRPGDKVDVTVAFTNRKGLMENKVLLEYVEIFACENKTVNSEDGKNDQRARNISLLLSPEQDGYVKIAQSRGQLALALRHPDDDEISSTNGVNSAALDDLKHSIGKGGDTPLYDRFAEDGSSSLHEPQPMTELAVAPPVAAAPQPVDVQSFLNGAAAAPATPEPAVKKWTMKVYVGNEPLNVEVDDPEAEADAKAQAAKTDAAGHSGGVPGLLKRMWSNGQK